MNTPSMSRTRLAAVAAPVLFALTTLAPAQDAKPDPKIERGRYIAEEVARCQECHSPKLENGEFDKTKWMKGATLVGVPAAPIPDWHQKAPDITSTSRLWERWKVEGFVKFFQT